MWRNCWHNLKRPLKVKVIHFGTNSNTNTNFGTIPHMRLPYRLSIVTFALGCTVLAAIHNTQTVQTERRQTDGRIRATVSTVGYNGRLKVNKSICRLIQSFQCVIGLPVTYMPAFQQRLFCNLYANQCLCIMPLVLQPHTDAPRRVFSYFYMILMKTSNYACDSLQCGPHYSESHT